MFGYNLTRADHCTNLENFVQFVRAAGIVRFLYVDGSFVTIKPLPRDIDVVIELPPAQVAAQNNAFLGTISNRQLHKSAYHVDAITSLYGKEDGMIAFFQQLRTQELAAKKLPNTFRKGILRLTLI